MKDLFQSERLVYRAIDAEKDEDLFRVLGSDSILYQLSNWHLPTPQKPSDAKETIKYATQGCLLSVVICLKSSSKGSNKDDESNTPIGVFYFMGKIDSSSAQHRRTSLALTIMEEYQNKGYGSEAVLWATDWAFKAAGMHRVSIGCFEYNPRALHLYAKLGFKEEGRDREAFWHNGRFWDGINFSLLDREWDEIVEKGKLEGQAA